MFQSLLLLFFNLVLTNSLRGDQGKYYHSHFIDQGSENESWADSQSHNARKRQSGG